MKNVLKTAVFALCMTVFAHGATMPVQNTSAWSLAAEYYGAIHGHEWLMASDESSLAAHMLRLHYAPFHFLRFTTGVGGSHAFSTNDLEGAHFGLAAMGGIGLYLSKPVEFFSVTAGYDGYLMKAFEEDEKYKIARTEVLDENDVPTGVFEERAYKSYNMRSNTEAALHTPYAALVFHISKFLDFEVGGQYRYFTATKNWDVNTWDENGNNILENKKDGFKDEISEQIRAFGTLTFHERESGAYITGGASYAAVVDDKYKKAYDKGELGQMARLSVWGQIGIIMRDPRGGAKKKSEYSDTYIDLKERQESMAEAIQKDIEREIERNREEGRDEHDFEEN